MKSDVIIIGGGIVGMSLACSLAKSGISTILIEQNNKKNTDSKRSDGRASAITYHSKIFLEKYNMWENLSNYASPIKDIKIIDYYSNSKIDFDSAIVGNTPLGYMIENDNITNCLNKTIENFDNLKIVRGKYNRIERDNFRVRLELGTSLYEASLLIAADGKNSNIRKLANIKTNKHDYGQTAIVCNISHEKSHHNIAYEKFYPTGPFAILPLDSGFKSSIVWVEKTSLARIYESLSKSELIYYLSQRFGDYLGELNLESEIFSYPINSIIAKKYYDQRLALIGDAAHSIHPIAGQGLNIGLADVNSIVDLIIENKLLGLDIGNSMMLSKYHDMRAYDNYNMFYITSILNSIFSNKNPLIGNLRMLGLNLINSLNPVKKFFMEYAMGKR